MAFDGNARSIPEIFRDLISQLTGLVRNEGRLAAAEVSEKVGEAATGLAFMVGGAVLLIPALVVLLGAAAAALVESGMSATWASLTVGAVALLIGLGLVWAGLSRLKPKHLVPTRTLEQLQRDATVVTHPMRHDHDEQRAA